MEVRFQSWLKTKTGCAMERLELSDDVRTISDLTALLADRHAEAAALFNAPEALRYVVDRRYVTPDHELASSAVLEIYPPVTGG